MLSVKKSKQLHLQWVLDKKYLLVNEWNDHLIDTIKEHDAIILTTKDVAHFDFLISKLRRYSSADVFLIPIFYKHKVNSRLLKNTDGLFQGTISNEKVVEIQSKINQLSRIRPNTTDEQIAIQLLQYLYTREIQLLPQKSRFSKLMYQFPFIDLFFQNDEFSIIRILQDLVSQGLLEAKLKDKIQLCHSCHDGILIFKETCPKCSSIDLVASDVIHHFKCAHIAPEKQFKNEENDDLVCPKCDKHLRHIGIDYDKPSSIYHCQSCDADFQDAEVVAECHSCHKQNQVEELVEANIHDYTLTLKGQTVAEQGALKKQDVDFSQSTVFSKLVQHEKIRSQKTKTTTYLVELTFVSRIFNQLPSSRQAEYQAEILQIVKNYVWFDDHILFQGNQIKFMLLEHSKKECKEACNLLLDNLTILLQDNLDDNVRLELSSRVL